MSTPSRERKFEHAMQRRTGVAVRREIKRIEQTSGKALRELWRKRLWCQAPKVKNDEIFRLLFAWRVQVRAYGDVDQPTLDKVTLIRRAITAGRSMSPVVGYLKPGMVLVRIWRGKEHRVLVRETGFEYRGHLYRTLSNVAHEIAGPQYSGPTFFGVGASGRKAVLLGKQP